LANGPQIGKFSKNMDFLGRNMTKNWENPPQTLKNHCRVWAAEFSIWAAGWPPLLNSLGKEFS
jgi:hypothetical protein